MTLWTCEMLFIFCFLLYSWVPRISMSIHIIVKNVIWINVNFFTKTTWQMLSWSRFRSENCENSEKYNSSYHKDTVVNFCFNLFFHNLDLQNFGDPWSMDKIWSWVSDTKPCCVLSENWGSWHENGETTERADDKP